ncbi:MAG: septal ring lytic transglycosylase RlpA family protein [Chitinophagaceae bacterium]
MHGFCLFRGMRLKKSKYLLTSIVTVLIIGLGVNVSSAQAKRHISLKHHMIEHGIASYYSHKFNGETTSSGAIFTNKGMTAASNTLPLGTIVKVTNLHNRKWVLVKVNDRMNIRNKRTIDLSKTAAKGLGMTNLGIARVKVEVIPKAFYQFFNVSPSEMVASADIKDNSLSN